MTEKRCTRCQIVKPLDQFNPRKDRPIGVVPHCRDCDKKRVKRYQQSEHGKRVLLAYSRLPEVKATRRKWRITPNGKASSYRSFAKKRKTDLNFRIGLNLRGRLNDALGRRRSYKLKGALKLLGCSVPDFRIYLESLFESGMTWENYGRRGWHIDHVVPCALFDLSKLDHQRRCFHFSNMQPMWWLENLSKGSRGHHQFRLI